jgi:acyl carrier protein
VSARQTFVDDMVAWINTRFGLHDVPVCADTPLFSTGVITSLRILELIAWTERATHRRIPDASIRMDNFATVTRIAQVFVREEELAHR